MKYKINWDDGVFAVPDEVCGCLKLASGKALKVLLYMLKYKGIPDDPDVIGVSPDDIEDALSYWEQMGIIIKDDPEAVTLDLPVHDTPSPTPVQAQARNTVAPTILAAVPENTPVDKKSALNKASKALLPAEIAQRIEESEEVAFLFRSAESCLKRVLTFTDQRTILSLYDFLGMPADIITMLIAYCCSVGRGNMSYISNAALDWQKKNISTHEQAENEILIMQKKLSFEGQVQSRLMLPERLSESQQRYINEWALWDIDIGMVELAYDITIDQKGKIAFPYMNTILKKWHDNGIKYTAEAIDFEERTKPSKQKQTQQAQQGQQVQSPQQTQQGQFRSTAKKAPPLPDSSPSFDLSLFMERAKNSTPKV